MAAGSPKCKGISSPKKGPSPTATSLQPGWPFSISAMQLIDHLEAASAPALLRVKLDLGEEDTELLAAAIKFHSTLTELFFCVRGTQDSSILMSAFTSLPSLMTLWVEWSNLESESLLSITAYLTLNSPLASLHLRQCDISDQEMELLYRGLISNSSLTYLDLAFNDIGAEGARNLAMVLKSNNTLLHLNLTDNQLFNEGARHLFDSLAFNASLLSLSLVSNEITSEGVNALSSSSVLNSTLTTLNLSSNHLGDAGADVFSTILRSNRTLKTLSLAWNKIGDLGVMKLARSLHFNTRLSSLNLDGNKFSDWGTHSLASACVLHSSLTNLTLRYTRTTDRGLKRLIKALSLNQSITDLQITGLHLNPNLVTKLHLKLQHNASDKFSPPKPSHSLFFTKLPPSRLLDLRQSHLTSSTTDLLPFLTTWHDAEIIDFREIPDLSSVPRSLAFLNPKTIRTIRFPSTDSWTPREQYLASLPPFDMICCLSFHDLPFDQLIRVSLPFNRRLDLQYLSLSDFNCDNLPFQSTWHHAQSIDLRNNSEITFIPRSIRYLDPTVTQQIIFDDFQREPALCSLPTFALIRWLQLDPILPSSGILDFRYFHLTNQTADFFHPTWRNAVVVDLRNNPQLTKVPRSIGLLNPIITQAIKFDQTQTWSEVDKFLISLKPSHLIRAMQLSTQNISPIFLPPFFKATTSFLNLRGQLRSNKEARRLPLYEPIWRTCRRIDLTRNPHLTKIPACLGFLDPNVTTQIDMDIDSLLPGIRPFAISAKAIIFYARGLLEGTVLLNQAKLMIVGQSAVGKTTLLRNLYGARFDPQIASTDGIDLGEFTLQGIHFSTWDFGGQKVYRFTHQLFLASNAIYLLLFKLSDGNQRTLPELRFWLSSIVSRCRDACILIVGTHADKVGRELAEARCSDIATTLVNEYPQLFSSLSARNIIRVNATKQRDGTLHQLRNLILSRASSVNIRAPENYRQALQFFSALTLAPPIIPLSTAIEGLQAHLSIKNASMLTVFVDVLDNLGLISAFPNKHIPSGGVIVLRPQWVAKLLSTIITTRHQFVNSETGLISHSVLTQQLWTDQNQFPPKHHPDLIHLLRQLSVLFPIRDRGSVEAGNQLYFVPSMLQEDAPDLRFFIPPSIAEHSPITLRRLFRLKKEGWLDGLQIFTPVAVPVAVIPPIMIDLMQQSELRAKWQHGCIARFLSTNGHLQDDVWAQLWRSRTDEIEIKVWGRSPQFTAKWMRLLASMVVVRLTEFYHIDHDIIVPCSSCPLSSPGHFDYIDLQVKVLAHQLVSGCHPHQLHHPRIDTLAPDLLFADLGLIFDWTQLREVGELGQGAFGRVIKMESVQQARSSHLENSTFVAACSSSTSPHSPPPTIPSTEVVYYAVKLLESKPPDPSTEDSFSNELGVFQEFRQEVYLMSSLDDPNVVKLHGICVRPHLAMIMEVVAGGDLFGQLTDPFRLKSNVFGLIKTINEEFTKYNLAFANVFKFKHIVLNRHLLADPDRADFEKRCLDALSALDSTLTLDWITEQYENDIRTPTLTQLQNRELESYGISLDKLRAFSLPTPPSTQTLGHGAIQNAKQTFASWKAHAYSVSRDLAGQVSGCKKRFFQGVDTLCQSWINGANFAQTKVINELTERLQDELQHISTAHSLILAPVAHPLRLKLALDIARGMVHLHEMHPPVVHRDLKTPNIFLTRSLIHLPLDDDATWQQPLAKIGDFGLSLRISLGSDLHIRDRNQEDVLKNLNPTWAAPEILNGEPYTEAVDVYAMGVVLWELMTRQHPFLDIEMACLARHITAGGRPVIRDELRSKLFLQPFIELMEHCWDQTPQSRPSMRQVFYSLLQQAEQQYPSIASFFPPLAPPSQMLDSSKTQIIYKSSTVTMQAVFPQSSSSLPLTPLASSSPPASSSSSTDRCAICKQKFGKFSNRPKRCVSCDSTVCAVCLASCCLYASQSPDPQDNSLQQRDPTDPVASIHRITLMIAPFANREILWFGMESGQVALRTAGPADQLVVSSNHESHSLPVNALVFSSSHDESGTIWSGSEDGTLHVWASYPRNAEDVLEANTRKGMLVMILTKKNQLKKPKQRWVECENGRLSWYSERFKPESIGTISFVDGEISSVVLTKENRVILIAADRTITLSSISSEPHGVAELKEWYRTLINLGSLKDGEAQIIRLASLATPSKAGILSLQCVDNTVWSANTQFLLTEWTLNSTAHEHGLHRTLLLHPLRQVQLHQSRLVSRLRTISGFVRVAENVLWVGVGNQWVVMDTSASTVSFEWKVPSMEMDKTVALLSVYNNHGQHEIWSCDHDGRLFVWSISTDNRPVYEGELKDPAWDVITGGRPYCLAQVGNDQVWMGTSAGTVLAWDIHTRHMVKPECQPLPAQHPLAHKRSIYALASIKESSPLVLWSASRDQTLRRFSW